MRARYSLCSIYGLGIRDAVDVAPELVSAIRMVTPADETEALRCVPECCCVPLGRRMASGVSGRQVRRLDDALCRASRL